MNKVCDEPSSRPGLGSARRETSPTSEVQVKAAIRSDLPPEVFRRRPLRCLYMVPLLAIVVLGSVATVALPVPWYLAAVLSIAVGNFHASMLFLAHEIGHGATVRTRWLQKALMYPGGAAFLLSPFLWHTWHNTSHHGYTNRADQDPDLFGTLDRFLTRPPLARSAVKAAPGSGYLVSAMYLFTFFTIQGQSVLWARWRELPGYGRLRRKRAVVDTGLFAAMWILIAVAIGSRGTLFAVVIPMAVANFVVLSYVVTNHMLRPLTDHTDSLGTAMSVTTFRVFDRMHFHFSHHVEHHLFPSMPTSMAPRVRASLVRCFGDRYLCPPHGSALRMVFRTPRIYDGPRLLVDPYRGARKDISPVEDELRRRQTLRST